MSTLTHQRGQGPVEPAPRLRTIGSVCEELREQFPKVWKPLTGKPWKRLRQVLEDRRPPATAPRRPIRGPGQP